MRGPPTEPRLLLCCGATQQTNVKEHIDRMKEGQNDIPYITSASIAVVSSLPSVEFVRKKGPEVLHVVNTADEFAVQRPKEFDGKKLESTAKDGLGLGDYDDENKLEELKAEFKPLMKFMEEVVGDKVEKVIVSDRIIDLQWVLTTSEYGWSANLERIAQQPSSSQQQLHGARQEARLEKERKGLWKGESKVDEEGGQQENRKVEVDMEGRRARRNEDMDVSNRHMI